MNNRSKILTFLFVATLGSSAVQVPAADLAEAIRTIRNVGAEGRGNAEASVAWKRLAQAEGPDLVVLLAGMDGAGDMSVNWLRMAVDAVVDRELKAGRTLPVMDLGEFLLNTRHHPKGRRLAFELIQRTMPGAADQLIPGLLNDPSADLRREPVARLLTTGVQLVSSNNAPAASIILRQALQAARDVDQIEAAAAELRKLGRPVDLPSQFGFLMKWKVVGPFDNAGGKGFQTVFPPEQRVDLAASYEGKGATVRWQDLESNHDLGVVDVNKVCGMLKEVTAYAVTEFVSEVARPVELRLGCKNAWKVWVNGQLLFGRDEYHRGAQIDQYRMPCQLRAGRNEILVKLCQNEQKEDWTKEWEFQLRICDEIGTAILSADRASQAGAKPL